MGRGRGTLSAQRCPILVVCQVAPNRQALALPSSALSLLGRHCHFRNFQTSEPSHLVDSRSIGRFAPLGPTNGTRPLCTFSSNLGFWYVICGALASGNENNHRRRRKTGRAHRHGLLGPTVRDQVSSARFEGVIVSQRGVGALGKSMRHHS